MKNNNNDETSKQRILTAATKLFAVKGFDGVSIREICHEADTNICMISYYWGGKKELYQGIIDDLVEKQTEYAKKFIDITTSPENLSKKEQIDLIMLMIEKITDFFYSFVSKDIIILLLKEQQSNTFVLKSPAINYFRCLLAYTFDKDEKDREMIFKTVFIISQINSPRIHPAFTLRLLGQEDFSQEDIKIIKDNVKFYTQSLLKEAGIV